MRVKAARPDFLAVSTSMNSSMTAKPLSLAYFLRMACWAGIEKPSRSCSRLETRA